MEFTDFVIITFHTQTQMAFVPLPKGLDESAVVEAIDPQKDVDAFHAYNVGKIMMGDYHFLPCTPAGIMELLQAY